MSGLKIVLVLLAFVANAPAIAQEAEQKSADEDPAATVSVPREPPYEAKLSRLAEVLGSVHYLRTLCGETGMTWRVSMEELLAAENPDAERKARLVARFNHGYRAFDVVHQRCNESAGTALARYMAEGEKLAGEIASRYGN